MKFKSFTLDNKLQVLAISDARFVKSAAAMSVMAGSMQNPDEHLGLAHFLEHMLFLGTKEFPKVGDYEDYLNKNGGGHNAYTSIDHTNYFFDVDHSAYSGAIERFSRFFVSPTFDPKYLEREVNAVDSEHEKNLKDDGRREYRVQQLITDPKHPFAKFATGDKKTLGNANRESVMDFYESHYSSNVMRLVMMSSLPPNEMEKIARDHFSDIKNRNLPEPKYEEMVFPKTKLPRVAQVKSIRDLENLKVSFDIPDDMPFWKSKPGSLLAHLVGDEGEGSLLSYLKDKGWALGLSTSTWWRTFNIRVTLTESGKKNYPEILKAIFAYVELLKKDGLHEYVFNERKRLAEIELENIEPKSSMGRASDFSASMLYYPVDEFLSQHYLYHEYSPKDFKHFLSFLRPDNMQLILFARDAKTNKTEEYYGIEYSLDNMPDALTTSLGKPAVIPELKLPPPNPYIPKSLDLVAAPKLYEPKKEEYKGKATIYWQVDTELEIPKGSIALALSADYIKADPKKYLTAQLYTIAKKQQLNEWGYPPLLAGLNYSISHGYNTITVEVSGYTEKLSQLLQALIKDPTHNRRLDQVSLSKELFAKIKEKYKKNLLNADFDAAYQKLLYENSQLFATGAVHRDTYKDMVDQITIEDLNSFAKEFFKKVAIRCYSYGNIDVKLAKQGIDFFLTNITDDTFSEKEVEKFENKYVELPTKKVGMRIRGRNNNNGQLSVYKLTPWSIANQAYIDVISKLLEQPFFTELRTNQQLGYVVAAFGSTGNGYAGLGTLIQSQNTTPAKVYEKANSFFDKLVKGFAEKIEAKDIDPIKAAIINQIKKKPNTLGERMSRFTSMAATYHGDFEYFDKVIKATEQVTAEGIKKFLNENYIANKNKGELSLWYFGSDSANESLPEGFEEIRDTKKFKAEQNHIQPYRKTTL